MTTVRRLRLDDDGRLILHSRVEDAEGEVLDESAEDLGPVESPGTSWRVPGGMEAEFESLLIDRLDAIDFGRACRDQGRSDYLAGIGAL